jgi:TolA-binding protein
MRRVILLMFTTFTLSGCAAESSIPPAAPAAPTGTADIAYRTATSLHEAAARTRDRADYWKAIAAYEHFLAENPNNKNTYDAVFYDAEARWAIEDWAGAAARYQRALRLRPTDEKSQDAAYANVLATRRAAGISEDGEDPKCDDASEGGAEPLPDTAVPIIDAYDLFLTTTKVSPERSTILYSKARILYSCRHFEEAEPLFANVVDEFGQTEIETAAAAAALLLDCLAEQGKTAETFTRAASLAKSPLASNPMLVKVLADIKAAREKS